MSDEIPFGTHKAVEIDGAWHVVEYHATGLLSLGPPQWSQVTVFGSRSRERTERKAERMTKRARKQIAKQLNEKAERLERRRNESARIESALLDSQDRSN